MKHVVCGSALLAGLALVAGFLRPAPARAQTPTAPACDDAAHREFDFWLGTWDVEQTIHGLDGSTETYRARSVVRQAAGGCSLVENWAGVVRFPWAGMSEPDSLHGLSVRYLDEADGQWRIHWLDDRDPTFGPPFVGGFVSEAGSKVGTFTRRTATPGGDSLTSRIRFERDSVSPGVEWHLAISPDGVASWIALWDMRFQRADPDSDVAALERAHATILRAHRDNDLSAWMALEGADFVQANRGRVSHPTSAERRAARGPYLRDTRFTRYEDLRDPIVTISDDGTLGWLIAEVAVEGATTGADGSAESADAVFAWIELYRKIDGEWRLVGNVSNQR